MFPFMSPFTGANAVGPSLSDGQDKLMMMIIISNYFIPITGITSLHAFKKSSVTI